jgi:hypothetical protein
MLRAGERVSPAMMAMYSRPEAAKSTWPISARDCLSMCGSSKVKGVKCMASWWSIAQNGAAISSAKARIIEAPLTLWIHLPRPRPRTAVHASNATRAARSE